MDSQDLVTVYTCTNANEAEVIRNALQAEGIGCAIDGENQAGLAGILEMRIQVKAADADRASRYVKQHEHH